MKKIVLALITVFLLGCSPKLKSTITTTLQPLGLDELVVVLDLSDNQNIQGTEVGVLKASDNGLSVNCTYYENENSLIKLAREAGANVIKITEHKLPDRWSSCHRLIAKLFYVSNPKEYETKIKWSAKRKLTWDDFKGKPDQKNFPNALALTNSGFGFESGASMFKEGEVFIESVFNTNESWVLPKGRNDYVLRHEQIHFDITEIYSRKLRKAFADANITSNDQQRAKLIFDQIFQEMQKRQEKYDRETQRGDKKETQENWEAIVILELAKYELYKKPE